jgi:ribonuclease HI
MVDTYEYQSQWTQVYAEEAVRNEGGGIYIKHRDGRKTKMAIATGLISSNCRAEAMALLELLKTIRTEITNPATNIVFLTDCKSFLESLETSRDSQAIMQDIISELNLLRESAQVLLQWIPSHCGIDGNEMADPFSRVGSCQAQYEHSVNFCEAKTIIRNRR